MRICLHYLCIYLCVCSGDFIFQIFQRWSKLLNNDKNKLFLLQYNHESSSHKLMLVFINNLLPSLKKSSWHTLADIIMHSSSIIWSHLSGTFVPGALLHHKFFCHLYCLSISTVLTTFACSQRTPSPYLPLSLFAYILPHCAGFWLSLKSSR